MRIIMMTIIGIICYVLQSTLLDHIAIYNIKPSLIVITTISYALIRGKEEGAIYGLFTGLLMDVMSGKVLGLFAIMGMFLGLIIGSLNKKLYNENYIIAFMLTAVGTFSYSLLFHVVSYFMGLRTEILWYIIGIVIPETVYNTALSLIIYFFILYFNKKLDYHKKTLSFLK